MAEVRIADLNLETSPATDDEVAIEDVSEGDTNKVTVADLLALIDDASAPQAISPTWTNPHTFSSGLTSNGELIANAGIDTNDAGPLNLAATNNTDQLNLRTDGNNAMSGSLKVGGTGAASGGVLDVRGSGDNIATFYGSAGNPNQVVLRFPSGENARLRFEEAGSFVTQIAAFPGELKMQSSDVGGGSFGTVWTHNLGEGSIRLPSAGSGTGTTAVFDSNDQIVKDSSSRRHKTDIEAADIDPQRVLDIDPAFYERDGSPEIGFIAEDFAFGQLKHGLGYDEQGRVHGFLAGSRAIDAAQQVVLKDHEQHLREADRLIEEVRSQANENESRIEELEEENRQLREQVNEMQEA